MNKETKTPRWHSPFDDSAGVRLRRMGLLREDGAPDRNLTNAKRKAIYRREGYRCALCDSTKYLQIHHIITRGHGGPNTPQNLICLCSDCHALAYGMDLRGLADVERDGMVDQAIVEYMADLYAENGYVWNPWSKRPILPHIGNKNLVGGW